MFANWFSGFNLSMRRDNVCYAPPVITITPPAIVEQATSITTPTIVAEEEYSIMQHDTINQKEDDGILFIG